MAGRKRRWRKSSRRLLIFCLALFLCLSAAVLFGMFTSITEVTIVGTSPYDEEELKARIFENPKEQSLLYAYLNEMLGTHKEIPFIERYDVRFTGLTSVEITLYEKSIVGCIEYMDSYMYFDREGIVVESSSEKKEGVPLISGLDFDRIVLYGKLSISSEQVFTDILNLTQLLEKYEMSVDKIYFDSQYHVVFYVDNIKVRLGSCDSLDGKITELKQMLPQLEGLSGTLYLDTYRENMPPSSYVFKKEEETGTEETESSESLPEETGS